MLRRILTVAGGVLLIAVCGAVLALDLLILVGGLSGAADIDLWAKGGSSADPMRPFDFLVIVGVFSAFGISMGVHTIARSRYGRRAHAAVQLDDGVWREFDARGLSPAVVERVAHRRTPEEGLDLRSVVLTLDGGVRVHVRGAPDGTRSVRFAADDGRRLDLDRDAAGGWTVDGVPRPDLGAAVAADFAASPSPLALLAADLELLIGDIADVVLVGVSWPGLAVERVVQRWERVGRATYRRLSASEASPDLGLRLGGDGLVESLSGRWGRVRRRGPGRIS